MLVLFPHHRINSFHLHSLLEILNQQFKQDVSSKSFGAHDFYKFTVDDIIFGSIKKSWCDEIEALMKSRFQISSMGELTFFLGLQVKQKEDVSPIETKMPLVEERGRAILMWIVHLYSIHDRFQVTPKTSHLNAVKRIFRKSTTGEAEYVAAANCRGQVLWIQNQMLDYGFNFMNTKIYIDNESTTCIVKNLVFHSKTKHIAIRHHFIRDVYEKKLIQVLKIHTDDNVADLLTKAFDVSSLYEEFSVQKNLDHSDEFQGSGGNHGDQAKEIKHLKAQIKKLKKKAKPVITHHKAWMKSVSMKQRLEGKKSLKKQWMQKEFVSKQGRKPAKAKPIVHKGSAFDELDDDTMDYMETENAQDVGRTSYVVHEEKESA
ncbi:hypothetical protein Tco_0983160 [Tanacetum coccineum]